MSYRISGLDPARFRHLYGLADAELAALGVTRAVADASPGFPDRVGLRDAAPGETLLLLSYEHQPADTAYRSRHAIFVLEGAERAYDEVGVIPAVMRVRMISLRAFDARGEMVDADLVDGADPGEGSGLEALIMRLLANPAAAYLHAHYAKRGCYAARIDRADPLG